MLNMDLDEWELLPSDGFINSHQFPSSQISSSSNPNSTGLIDMDYFQKLIDPPKSSRVVVPIEFDHKIGEIPVEEKLIPEDQNFEEKIQGPKLVILNDEEQQETVSQVFFKKEKNEFVDMKMDSPKSLNMGFLPQIDVGGYQFGEKDGNFEDGEQIKEEIVSKLDEKEGDHDHDHNHDGGLNVWKWAMSGIGALFSFGFAAATVSLIVLGNRHKENKPNNKGKELHFKLYSHDKRMKQVVHHATKLNEAINNAVRGAPLTRAHITIGGYYEGL